jgi:hypothetical protein
LEHDDTNPNFRVFSIQVKNSPVVARSMSYFIFANAHCACELAVKNAMPVELHRQPLPAMHSNPNEAMRCTGHYSDERLAPAFIFDSHFTSFLRPEVPMCSGWYAGLSLTLKPLKFAAGRHESALKCYSSGGAYAIRSPDISPVAKSKYRVFGPLRSAE